VELRARRAAALAAAVAALLLAVAAPALAAAPAIDKLKLPVLKDKPPDGYVRSSVQAVQIADRDPKVIAEKHRHDVRAFAYVKRPRSSRRCCRRRRRRTRRTPTSRPRRQSRRRATG